MTETKTVPLAELDHDPVAIEGHEIRLTKLDDLLASIPEHGLNQSLRVRPWAGKAKKGGPKYAVIAGNRRLATLKQLMAKGGSILGIAVDGSYPVPVIIGDDNDVAAYEIRTAENVQRLPETVVGEFRAFAKMAETTPVKEIASRFGVSEKRVQQRLKLAQLHPDVLAALELEKITMEAAQAFTLQPDPAKQAAYLKKNGNDSWRLGPNQIKAAFTEKVVRGDGKIAQLIGKKAYVAAGGLIMGDAFDDKAAYWISPKIVEQLLEAHWADQKKAWLDEGWLFVETADQFAAGKGHYVIFQAEQLEGLPMDLTGELVTEASTVKARISEIEQQFPILDEQFMEALEEGAEEPDEAPEEISVELDNLYARLEEIEEAAPRAYSAEQKAVSGVVYWEDGSQAAHLGMVRQGTVVANELGGRGVAQRNATPQVTLENPGNEISKLLHDAVAEALRQKLTVDVRLAKCALYAALYGGAYGSPVDISAQFEEPEEWESPSFPEALKGALSLTDEQLDLGIAKIVGMSVDAAPWVNREALASLVAAADHAPIFDATTYFAALTKPLLHKAWNDMRSPLSASAKSLADGKLEVMAKQCQDLAFDTKWLPPQLRTPSYNGPSFVTAKAEPTEDDEQLQAAE